MGAKFPLACSSWDHKELNAMQSVIDSGIFTSLGDFRDKFRNYFWEVLYQDVGDVLLLLRETINGRKIVSKIYAHL